MIISGEKGHPGTVIRIPTAGSWIAVEGVDGTGKSTLVGKIHSYVNKQNHTYHVVRCSFPGYRYLDNLHGYITDNYRLELHPISKFLSFLSCVTNDYYETVIPAVNKSRLVISDRSPLSTRFYAYADDELDKNYIDSMMYMALDYQSNVVLPDLTIVMTVKDVEVCFERDKCLAEEYEFDYIKRVNDYYRSFEYGERKRGILNINADCSEEQVWKAVKPHIDNVIYKKYGGKP